MMKRSLFVVLILTSPVLVWAPASASEGGGVLAEDQPLARASYQGTTILWEPLVEYQEMVLTIGGPHKDIVKVFGPEDPIFFDLSKLEGPIDGQYTWELRRVAAVDESVRETLRAARGTAEADTLWRSFHQRGLIPGGPYVASGWFSVASGGIVDPIAGEASREEAGGTTAGAVLKPKDVVFNDDVILQQNLCVGFGCVNGVAFSDTSILLQDVNNRIKFDDTSSSSFPSNDWEIEANSSISGGASYLGFNDCGNSFAGGCTDDLVFAVEAGVRSSALYVESDGEIGVGTANPVATLHMVTGDTPSLRLEQDGSSGFTPQVWEVFGNEAGFFVQDVSAGSFQYPFRIEPGADDDSLVIDDNGNVGMGTMSPMSALHVTGADGTTELLVSEGNGTSATRTMLRLLNNGGVRVQFDNTSGDNWTFTGAASYNIDFSGNPGLEAQIQGDGDMVLLGTLTTNGPLCGGGCDRVFQPDYELESIEEHAAKMWANSYLPAVGPTPEGAPFNLTQKTGGMLNELEKAHIYIEQLHATIQSLKAEVGERGAALALLEERLVRLESSLDAGE